MRTSWTPTKPLPRVFVASVASICPLRDLTRRLDQLQTQDSKEGRPKALSFFGYSVQVWGLTSRTAWLQPLGRPFAGASPGKRLESSQKLKHMLYIYIYVYI